VALEDCFGLTGIGRGSSIRLAALRVDTELGLKARARTSITGTQNRLRICTRSVCQYFRLPRPPWFSPRRTRFIEPEVAAR
jgi:hypothetical protein